MLDVDLVRGRPPLEIDFQISLPEDLWHAVALVVLSPNYEGLDLWVYATRFALQPDLKAEMGVMAVFARACVQLTWDGSFSAADPIHRDFATLVARLENLAEGDIRRQLQERLAALAMYYREKGGREVVVPSLDDAPAMRDFLWRKVDPRYLDQIVRIAGRPLELKARFLSMITRFWEQFYREEYMCCFPLMERSAAYHRRQDYRADFAAVFAAVTGRSLPTEYARYKDVERVVFIPSCHIGPYFYLRTADEPQPLVLLTYNCRPTSTPDRDGIPAAQELFPPIKALADETRLQILAMLDGRELYAQQIVQRLGISQSAVSRHLQLMVAAQVLSERKEESTKYYSLNEDTLTRLAERLSRHRGRSG